MVLPSTDIGRRRLHLLTEGEPSRQVVENAADTALVQLGPRGNLG
jgi:hypothetical protein